VAPGWTWPTSGKHGVLFPRWTAWTNYGSASRASSSIRRFVILGAALSLILPDFVGAAAFILLTQTWPGYPPFSYWRRLTGNPGCLAPLLGGESLAWLVASSQRLRKARLRIFPFSSGALRLAGFAQEERSRRSVICLPFFRRSLALQRPRGHCSYSWRSISGGPRLRNGMGNTARGISVCAGLWSRQFFIFCRGL